MTTPSTGDAMGEEAHRQLEAAKRAYAAAEDELIKAERAVRALRFGEAYRKAVRE